jgi:hypothetical protein
MFFRHLGIFSLIIGTVMSAGEIRANDEATMSVSPKEATAGSYQHVRFEFTAGDSGIAATGGVRLEIPVAYLETEPYFWDRPQIDIPAARGYVKASSTGDATIQVKVYGASGGIIECTVAKGTIKPGEKIDVDYSGIVQSYTWEVRIRGEWRKTAEDSWKPISALPEIKILPQNAVTMLVVAPSDLEQGAGFDLAVVLLDKFGNAASRYRGVVSFTSSDPNASLPKSYTFTANDSGVHVFSALKYQNEGFQCITVTDGNLEVRSNYSSVSASATKLKRYFGDTHFHTGSGTGNKTFTTSRAGGDHRGHFTTENEAYAYARDVMRLDFASAAEHDAPELTKTVWQMCQAIADSFNDPGRFTTFFAYEWTASPREGHHVVVYKDRGNTVFDQREYSTKPALWQALDKQAKPVLVIPHDMWAQPDHGIWENINNDYRKVGEIYSLWNNRFLLQPADEPQRFELGINNAWSYQYAWDKGHTIGVIGSSDNHTARPGMNNYTIDMQHPAGLAVVLAKGNNREDLWDALQHRRTYATTGTRIYLDFTSDGHFMGDEYAATAPPVLSVKVAGTNKLDTVEIVKHDSKGYQTICTKRPESEVCIFQFTDNDFAEDSFYYARVAQVDEFQRGAWSYPTNEMAWSSPIWVNKSR